MPTNIIYDSLTKSEGIIYIDETTTDEAVKGLQKCIDKGQINPENYDTANIMYDCSKGLPVNPDEFGHFPLEFVDMKRGTAVYVSGVTAGYGGTGPHGTLRCLEMMGFILTEEQRNSVLTKRKYSDGTENPHVTLIFKK